MRVERNFSYALGTPASAATVRVTPKAASQAAPQATPMAPLGIALAPTAETLAQHLKARGFTGEILTAAADIKKYSGDYGKIASAMPRIVVKPKTQADVQLAVQTAIADNTQIR